MKLINNMQARFINLYDQFLFIYYPEFFCKHSINLRSYVDACF